MDRNEYVCNQMYKQHALLRKDSWTDADKLEYMELNIAPYSRYWRMGMKKALKHAIKLLREEEAKADRKTENSSEKPNNCEHITEDGVTCARYPACDDCHSNPLNKVKGSERLVKGSDEAQTEPQRNTAEDIVKSFGFKAESYRQAKAKTEQTEREGE